MEQTSGIILEFSREELLEHFGRRAEYHHRRIETLRARLQDQNQRLEERLMQDPSTRAALGYSSELANYTPAQQDLSKLSRHNAQLALFKCCQKNFGKQSTCFLCLEDLNVLELTARDE
mgnify:FL=1